jgi:hypothetical protein
VTVPGQTNTVWRIARIKNDTTVLILSDTNSRSSLSIAQVA